MKALQHAIPPRSSPSMATGTNQRQSVAPSTIAMSAPVRIQPKLTVNTPGDKYEQEADRVAEQVMRMPEPQVQRQCSCGGSTKSGECPECKKKKQEEKGKLQRDANSSIGGMTAPPIVNDVLNSPGSPLPTGTRSFMESRFGQDFSHVKVHTNQRAAESAAAVQAKAYTIGNDIVFGHGANPCRDQHLLAHELTHIVQQRGGAGNRVQRSPLSDSVGKVWKDTKNADAVLDRLSRANAQGTFTDADLQAELKRIFLDPGDLWVAQRVWQGKLGDTTGTLGKRVNGKTVSRPVNAFFFQGKSSERALIIGGVHGTEVQGTEVIELLMENLKKRQPHFTVILVPSLFPDLRSANKREGGTPTNRNFPTPDKDLAAATKGGKPVDEMGRDILSENIMLMNLMERFKPSRIASIHGTQYEGAGGAFYDPRELTAAETDEATLKAREDAYYWAAMQTSGGVLGTGAWQEDEATIRMAQLGLPSAVDARTKEKKEAIRAADEKLSLDMAEDIHAKTKDLPGLKDRDFRQQKEVSRDDDEKKRGVTVSKEKKAARKKTLDQRKKFPSVAGNIDNQGKLKHAYWSGSTPGGTSLGGYAPARGMTVITVEPPVNEPLSAYKAGTAEDGKVDEATRKVELQAYADALEMIFLGKN